MAINDFGEKIGGAKKDLWRERGLQIEDLLDMNDAEKVAHIKKDNVWKKPDYQALVDSGLSRRVVYFMKKIRDATPTKPVLEYGDNTPELIAIKQEGYISFVQELRDAVLNLKTEADVLGFYKNYLSEKYITRKPGSYYVTVSDDAFGCVDNKLLKAAQLNSFNSIDRDIKKKEFCYSAQDKLEAQEKAFMDQFDIVEYNSTKVSFEKDYADRVRVAIKLGYGTHYFYPEGEDADQNSYEESKWFVVNRSKVLAKNLESRSEAEAMLKEAFQKLLEKQSEQPAKSNSKRKTRFVPKQLEHIHRNGENYRQGVPATGEKYMKVFGFKGGEFGNWMSENDRKASLDYGYDALVDMCKALNISTKDISLGGHLSIAFGARGSAGAAAHYEPLREVINLTKMNGAGSLAHEWAHALDDIFGKEIGLSGFMTENPRNRAVPEALTELVNSMKYKKVCDEETLKRQNENLERAKTQLINLLNYYLPSQLTEKQKTKKNALIDECVEHAVQGQDYFGAYISFAGMKGEENPYIEALSEFKKEVTGRVIPREARKEINFRYGSVNSAAQQVGKQAQVKTDFYENSIRFDDIHSKADHGYWQSTVEMFARAFACYVHDKLEGQSDYLVGHSENAVTWVSNKRTNEMELVKAIPDGDERVALNKCFDKLIVQLKERGLLHDYEPLHEVVVARKPSLMEQINSSQRKYAASVRETSNGQLQFEL